jgi:very-short-patch-repair endonuclease
MILWSKIKNRQLSGVKFRRQHPEGHYIVDFACLEHKLIVEIDGGHHNEEFNEVKDTLRTGQLEASGFRVLRFWNNEVKQNIDGVIYKILEALGKAT